MTERKQVYKITYPNGKIYIGMDLYGNCTYFGHLSKTAQENVNRDLADCRMDFTVRKEIMWESETASLAEVRAKEIEAIMANQSNNPAIGYNLSPRFRSS